jgi:hypothetical protein
MKTKGIWKEFSKKNVREVYGLIDTLRRTRGLTQKELCKHIGVTEAVFSRWKSRVDTDDGWQSIGEHRLSETIEYLDQKKMLQQSSTRPIIAPADIFSALCALTSVKSSDIDYTVSNVVGRYEVYRESFWAPGYILRGLMTIEHERPTNTITTKEHYYIQKDVARMPKTFKRSGYFLRGERISTVVSRKDDVPEIQVMFLKNLNVAGDGPNPQQMLTMDGLFVDYQGGEIYASGVSMYRIEGEPKPDHVKAMEEKDVPPDVRARVQKRLTMVTDHIVKYI